MRNEDGAGRVISGIALSAFLLLATIPGMAQHEHHAGHDTAPDELGRRLHGMKHEIDPATGDALRAIIPLYENYSDAQLGLSMEQMGPNYSWYISDSGIQGRQGVLVLAHGFRDHGDAAFRNRMQPIADIFPTALALGMSMMMSDHIQLAVQDLEAKGVEDIVAVPAVSTRHNSMMRQWEYIFGLREDAAYLQVDPVVASARIHLASPPEDDPLVAEILLDHALELSENPRAEEVIIVAHGPTPADDNALELEMLATLAGYMLEDSDFAAVSGITLQDDAPPSVRNANVARLRGMVEAALGKDRRVLVVSNLMGTRTIQAKLRKDLKGLDYGFNAKGIMSHDNFMKWVGETIRGALEAAD